MRNALLLGLSAVAFALGGCTMEHASAIGDPAAGLQSPSDVVNDMWYGLYGGAYPDKSGSSLPQAHPSAAPQAPQSTATSIRQSSADAPQSPADVANEIYYGPYHGGRGVLSSLLR